MTENQVLIALWTGAFFLVHIGVIARVILRPHAVKAEMAKRMQQAEEASKGTGQ